MGALPTLATLLWGLMAAAPSVPQPAWLPTPAPWQSRRSGPQAPTWSNTSTLCFPPRDQPQPLMLCHFPSHVLLMRHGKAPARFNIPRKLPGQGSLFSLVLHKALCDQIRHGAIGVRNTWCTQGCLPFPQEGNRALPSSSQPLGI